MPNFLVAETTVHEDGESAILSLSASLPPGYPPPHEMLARLEISHVRQQQDLDVHIYASRDGVTWTPSPVASFLGKMHCGTYKIALPHAEERFLKAVWRLNRRGGVATRPLVQFRLDVEPVLVRAMAGAA